MERNRQMEYEFELEMERGSKKTMITLGRVTRSDQRRAGAKPARELALLG